MREFKEKIRNKLLLIYLTPISVVLITFGLITYVLALRGMEDELSKRLITIAKSVSTQLIVESIITLEPGDEDSRTYRNTLNRLNKLKKLTKMRRIYIFKEDNSSLVDTNLNVSIGQNYLNHNYNLSELRDVFSGRPRSSTLFTANDGTIYKTGFYGVTSAYDNTMRIGVGVEGNVEFYSTLIRLRRNVFLLISVSILLVIIVSILFSRKIVRPLKSLLNATNKMGRGDLSMPIPIDRGDEIGLLSYRFDQMRQNILERDQRLQMMLRGIAHEVRNPLGGIEMFLSLLRDNVSDNPESLNYISKITKESKYLKEIVNEFLDYAGEITIETAPVEAQAFIDEVSMFFQNDMADKNIILTCHIERSVIYIDVEYMRRVFFNLFQNAIQSIESDGGITVTVRSCKHDDQMTEVLFSDTGKGVSEEYRSKLFTPFFTTKAKGTGLGLALTKKIVESHGGQIKIYNHAEGGAVVEIRLRDKQELIGV